MRRSSALVLISFALITACAAPDGSPLPAGPTASAAPPTLNDSPTPAPAGPTGAPGSSAVSGLFQPVAGFTFEPAPAGVVEGFEAAAAASMGDAGAIGDAQGAQAVRSGSEPVTVVAFTLIPSGEASEDELLAEVMGAMAGGAGGEWTPDPELGVFVLETDGSTSVIGPWGTVVGGTVYLFATGAPGSPVKDVARALFGSS
jgi:hypothetical protein